MKHYIIASLLAVSFTASAQVDITESEDGTKWVGYPETVEQHSDGVSAMFGRRFPGKTETRVFVGITYADCFRGYGNIVFRNQPDGKWGDQTNVTLQSVTTVADVLANVLCSVIKPAPKDKKPEKKVSRTA